VASSQKKARRIGAHIVFQDETGFLMHPVLRRTWAAQGHTPIIRPRGRSHEKVSGAGALAISPKGRRFNWYLSLLPKENFRWPRLLTFLKHLRRHIRGPVILLWDRSQSHKNPHVLKYLAQAGWQVELLPSYAPELNPVEHFWSYFKFGRLSNFTPNTTEEIRKTVRLETRRAQRSQRLIRSIASRCSLPLFRPK
jgi:transposase